GVQKVREAASRTQCQNNLKQIGLALHNYHDTNKHFPTNIRPNAVSTVRLRWATFLLPYIEQGNLYNNYDQNANWSAPVNLPITPKKVAIYQCPSTPNQDRLDGVPEQGWVVGVAAVTDYAQIYGIDARLLSTGLVATGGTGGLGSKTQPLRFADIIDGASN